MLENLDEIAWYPALAVAGIVEEVWRWLPIVLILNAAIFLIGLRLKMTSFSADQPTPANPFDALDQLAAAVNGLLNAPPAQFNPTEKEVQSQPANSVFSPEYEQKRKAIKEVFQQGYDTNKGELLDLAQFAQALKLTEEFITEFWEEIPTAMQENLDKAASLILTFLPAIEGDVDYTQLILPFLNEVRKRPLRIIKSLLNLRRQPSVQAATTICTCSGVSVFTFIRGALSLTRRVRRGLLLLMWCRKLLYRRPGWRVIV